MLISHMRYTVQPKITLTNIYHMISKYNHKTIMGRTAPTHLIYLSLIQPSTYGFAQPYHIPLLPPHSKKIVATGQDA